MYIHLVSRCIGVLQALSSALDINVVRLQNVLGYVQSACRAIDLERFFSAHDPGCENDVGKTEGVIRV